MLSAAMAATVFLVSCDKENELSSDPVVYANKTAVGNGNARAFITNVNNHDNMELGFTLDVNALEGLPHHETSFLLDIPEEAKTLTPYKHISLDWAPHGHDPSGVYDKPHFDVHFYMISREEQNAICDTSAGMQKLPGAGFLPPTYVPEPGGISKMGKHWVDVTSPELDLQNPSPFTQTLIYGTYDAQVIFLEPMITRDFLLSKPDVSIDVKQPEKFAVEGHYPLKYNIRHDEAKNQLIISLSGFIHR